ncbi:hypothetical protein EPUS_07523 [Endocarpon pusillum Z07020]|uniref:Uncharacterized protein n=1 Tax=Endocarpon pusillum (strain Z07020 / HMAS-L-300199) TaxID=1263415 RepID=U1HW27_ENDPU|nr:uncharacterized protein EPUS_07523 [Endocarpon pusillum Z07020]ERF73589.1 hypothetical protein EPUS_07523 [Endocarpon pusillum Z07020]
MPPMPTTKLASIKQGLPNCQKIAILHQATEDSKKVTLYPAFPKELAIVFSGYIAKAFNAVPLSQIPLAEMKPQRETQVLIEGGNAESHGEVLEWILSCGRAGKTVPFRWFNSPAFHAYGLVYLSCAKLQVNVLQAQVQARMRDIAAKQVHTLDVERVFSSLAGPHMFKDMVSHSIGQAMWDGRLQAMGAYKALFKKEEYAEFKEGVDAVYDKLLKQWHKTPEGKTAKKEQEEKDRKAEEKREKAKERRQANFQRAAARRHNVDPSSIKPSGSDTYTLTTDARQVRKAQDGRPGFVQLDLGTLGVSSRDFRRADCPALAPKEQKSSPTVEKPAATHSAGGATAQVASKEDTPGDKGKANVDAIDTGSPAKLIEGLDDMKIG